MPTKIAWTDERWNPVRGCSPVSRGCERCYAMRMAHRFSGEGGAYEGLTRLTKHGPKWTGEVRCIPELLDAPLRWRKPRRVFVNSMSDLWHEGVPDEFLDRVFAVMACKRRSIFQTLTKRPERMQSYMQGLAASSRRLESAALELGWTLRWEDISLCPWPLPNVHLGISAEDQPTLDERVPHLLQTPAAVRWLSLEPLLGPVDLTHLCGGTLDALTGWNTTPGNAGCETDGSTTWGHFQDEPQQHDGPKIDWVVVGGESGPGARPCNVEWIRSVVRQCRAAGVPVFVKQLGSVWARERSLVTVLSRGKLVTRQRSLFSPPGAALEEWPEDLRVQEYPS